MSWKSRQNRLRAVFGGPEAMYLQVFVIVHQSGVSESKFNTLVEENNFNTDDSPFVKYLPKPRYGEIEFRPGLLIVKQNGDKYVGESKVQPVFTSADKKLIHMVKSAYENDPSVCQSNSVLDTVMSKYTGEIERQFPELEFVGKRYADVGHLSVEFQFGIQPYRFDLHPPRDMDVLKPITIIEGHVIQPSASRINDFGLPKVSP